MAKKQALLFELMKEDENPQVQKGFWDHFFRKTEEEVASSHQHPVDSREPGLEDDAMPPDAALSDVDKTGATRMYLRINTFTKVIGITMVLVIFFCGYILGKQIGWKKGPEHRSDQQLSQIAAEKVDTEAVKILPEEKHAIRDRSVVQVPAEPVNPTNILKNEGNFTRKNGVNYLIIQISREKPDLERAQAFLAGKGVEATIEQQGRLCALISVNGYVSLKESRQESDSFRAQIKALGQLYRQQKEANKIDFNTCYYKKWP
ncbi:MAG: hypothetical protein WC975_16260 [Phycisphaerae bacterium]